MASAGFLRLGASQVFLACGWHQPREPSPWLVPVAGLAAVPLADPCLDFPI